MRKLLFVVFILSSSNVLSQNMTLDNLFLLCNTSNWDRINDNLLIKGWEYHESVKGDDEHYSTITWSFNKDSYSDKAQAWMYLYVYEGYPNKISYQVFNKQAYNLIKSGVTKNGLKLVENKIEDDEIITKYSGSNFLVTITATKTKNDDYFSDVSMTAYSVIVIKKEGVYDDQNGRKIVFYDNGNIEMEYNLLNGKLNGKYKSYYENGNLKKETSYINGVESGKGIDYNENGEKKVDYQKHNGELNGLTIIYEEGRKSQEITHINGAAQGKFIQYIYDEVGSVEFKIVGNYLDDKEDGKWTVLNVNGAYEVEQEYTTYKNGIKNGAFSEYIGADTLITGFYKNGVIEGPYKSEVYLVAFGKDDGKKSGFWVKSNEGNYSNGLKNGKWKYYVLGNIWQEGEYKDNKKNGKWIEYLTFGNKIGEISSESYYEDDKRNGLSLNYFDMETERDTTNGANSILFKFLPKNESQFFTDDIENGQYVLKDSLNKLICKGNYKMGKMDGPWTESIRTILDDGRISSIYFKGVYVDNNKHGKWDETWEILGPNYRKREYFFNNGILKLINIYDSTGTNISHEYKILHETEYDIRVCKTFYEDKIVSQEYILRKNDFEEIEFYEFQNTFLQREGSDFEAKCYPLGKYLVSDKKGRPLIEGTMKRDIKDGKWKYWFYDEDVLIEQEYISEIGGIETFSSISNGLPFSGDFVQYYPSGIMRFDYSISRGMRNGKSKYFDEAGNLLLIEKYKDGLIKQ